MTAVDETKLEDQGAWNIERPGDYRLFATVGHSEGAMERARDQISTWLRERDFDVDPESDGHYQRGERDLVIVSRNTPHARDYRFRLQEQNRAGRWLTEFTAHVAESDASWLQLSVGSDSGQFVDVPRLARYLMDVLPLQDGISRLASHPITVRVQGVDELIDALCDPDRRGLILAAGTAGDIPFDRFVSEVQQWTRQVVGLANVVVLDPLATQELNDALGESHAVQPWTVRTFMPQVDPAVAIDSRRHRTLGSKRLADDSNFRIERLLGRISREHAAQRVMSHSVTKVGRALSRQEDRELLLDWSHEPAQRTPASPTSATDDEPSGPHAQPPPPHPTARQDTPAPEEDTQPGTPTTDVATAAEEYLQQREMVKRILGIDQVDESALRGLRDRLTSDQSELLGRIDRQLTDRQERIENLEDQLAFFKELYEEEELDHATVVEERDAIADENRWLRVRLAEAKDFDAAYHPIPDSAVTEYPKTFEALTEQLPSLEECGVIFTGDVRIARRLDDVDNWGKAVRLAWESLLTLVDYVRARAHGGWDGGVAQYLEEPPTGFRQVPPSRHAPTETAATMQEFGELRRFPVLPSVHPDGTVLMPAHFKLGRIGMVSPRMHYFDNWTDDGRVYVGYIGTHLKNTQTN